MHYWLVLWPATLSPDWAYSTIPPVESLGDLRNLATAGFFGVTFISLVLCLVQRGGRVAATTAALLLVPFLPMTNLFFPVGFVVAERVRPHNQHALVKRMLTADRWLGDVHAVFGLFPAVCGDPATA